MRENGKTGITALIMENRYLASARQRFGGALKNGHEKGI